MGDTIDISDATFDKLTGYHQDAEDVHVANGEPGETDAGWAAAPVSTIVGRISELVSASIIVNGSGVSGLEMAKTTFANSDEDGADLFNDLAVV